MNQSVPNGSTTQAVNFTGTGKSFSWVNDTPGIGLAVSGTGNIASFTPINKGATAVTATITVTPQPAAFAYIPNFTPNLDVVSVVNLANNSVTTTIPVGASPIGVAVNPDGTRVYTANQGSNTISVISTATNALLTTIQLAPGAEPSGIVVSADGSRVYAADYGTSYLSIIDAVTNTQITAVAVGSHPFGLALSPDGSTVYTSSEDNTVCVVNTASRSLVATINVGQVPNGICLSPDGSMLYVTNSGDNTVSVINTATNLVISSIAVGKAPVNIITSADGSIFYVTNSADNTVSVINASSGKVISVINVGSDPIGMSLNSDGSKLYVSNSVSDYVSVINTSTNAVIGTITVGTSAYAFGNFIIGGNGCAGMPVTFTITAEPALPNGISTSGVLAPLTTIYGTPSPSESFNVSGTGLIAGISVSPPTGFEVSTDNVNFSATVTVGKGGAIASTLVYVRLAAATPVGPYMGNITLSSAGVPDNDVFMPASTVNPALLSIIADDKSKTFGMANPVLTATYIGFVNFDTPVQLTSQAQLTTSAVTSSPAGQYPINVSGAASSNYTISQVPGVLTVYPVIESIVIPNTFTPNGDGINDTWNIKFLNFNLNCSVDVYNRWGEKVYSSIGYGIPWDGTYKGAALPVGTYYYIINLKTGQKALSGYVAIIR
jgi:gliding motility-associated-like protein